MANTNKFKKTSIRYSKTTTRSKTKIIQNKKQTTKNWQKMCMAEKPRKQFFCAVFNTSSILNSVFFFLLLVLLPLFDTFTSSTSTGNIKLFPPKVSSKWFWFCLFDGYFVAVCCLNYPGIQIEISLTASCRHSKIMTIRCEMNRNTEGIPSTHPWTREKKSIQMPVLCWMMVVKCQCWKLLN